MWLRDVPGVLDAGQLQRTVDGIAEGAVIHAAEVEGQKILEQVFQYENGLADYVDFFVIGEGEEVIAEITAVIGDWKRSGSL